MANKELVEFKVKEYGKTWETGYVVLARYFDYDDVKGINYVADILSEAFTREVRWNYAGSSQGHYIVSSNSRLSVA